MNKITCQVCGKQVHSIQVHLTQEHAPGSAQPMTLAEYTEKFPLAPLLSELAKKQLEKKQAEKAAVGKKAEPVVEATQEKAAEPKALPTTMPLDDLFELGGIKAARTKSGKPIPVTICQQTDYPEFVPDIDSNYVYDVEALKTVLMGIETNVPVYLYGPAGVGKTTLPEQICARTKRRIIRVQHTPNTEESHIVGQWVATKKVENGVAHVVTEFQLGPLAMAMIHGWVYLADEYDRAYPSVLSVYQAVLEGKPLVIKEADADHRVIRPHPDFRFIATGNTNGSGDETGLYQATVVQDAATIERFGIVLKIDYMDEKQEKAIIKAQARLTDDDAAKMVEFGRKIREQHPNAISLTIGPRVLINAAKIGLMRGDFAKGIELAFANRLPASEREAALQVAQRVFG